MRVSLLGTLQVEGGHGPVVLGAAKERSLLSALALRPGSVVATDSLIVALWGDEPPATARKTLQTYVWNLRQALGADVIGTDPQGYALHVAPDDVDVCRFRTLVRQGEDALRRSDSTAVRTFAEAVALWRGAPFPGVASHTGLARERVRLTEEYLSALEARLLADLADGRHEDLVPELEALVREHPYRERLWGNLMVALYRCGRQADALAAYQRARELLASELGLEPGGELRRLEAAVLNHDSALLAPAGAGDRRPPTLVRSPVRYATCPDGVRVAFQVAGEGPLDILAITGFASHLDIWWNAPTDRLVSRLTGMGRLISMDKRGMGLSDRPATVEIDDWVQDALAVLDAVGSERAVVLGVSAGSLTALLLASQHPERVHALAFFGGFARQMVGADYDVGHDRYVVEGFVRLIRERWGTGVAIGSFAPSRRDDQHVRDYWARYQLLSATPTSAVTYLRACTEADVREVLPTISVPTLVVHAERDLVVPVGQGRYIADHVPGAQFVALDSDVHLICVSDVIDELSDELEAFLRRVVPGAEAKPVLVTALVVARISPVGCRQVDGIVARCGGRSQRPPGTAVFDSPAPALRCARALLQELRAVEPHMAIGIHSSECFRSGAGVHGAAVDVARTLAGRAPPGEIVVSRTVRDLSAAGDVVFEDRGQEGSWDVYGVVHERVGVTSGRAPAAD